MSRDIEHRIRNVTAVLGPTNTGKTHLAIERMLGTPVGHDRPAAAAAGARGLRQIVERVGAAPWPWSPARRRSCPTRAALLGVHGGGHAARRRRRLPGRRRGAARRRSGARPCVHRPPAASRAAARDACSWAPQTMRAADRRSDARRAVSLRGRASRRYLCRREEAHAPATALGHRRVLRCRGLRRSPNSSAASAAAQPWSWAPWPAHAQRPGGALSVRRSRLPGRDRRHRHGPEHRRRPCGFAGSRKFDGHAHARADAGRARPDRRTRRAAYERRHLWRDRATSTFSGRPHRRGWRRTPSTASRSLQWRTRELDFSSLDSCGTA